MVDCVHLIRHASCSNLALTCQPSRPNMNTRCFVFRIIAISGFRRPGRGSDTCIGPRNRTHNERCAGLALRHVNSQDDMRATWADPTLQIQWHVQGAMFTHLFELSDLCFPPSPKTIEILIRPLRQRNGRYTHQCQRDRPRAPHCFAMAPNDLASMLRNWEHAQTYNIMKPTQPDFLSTCMALLKARALLPLWLLLSVRWCMHWRMGSWRRCRYHWTNNNPPPSKFINEFSG